MNPVSIGEHVERITTLVLSMKQPKQVRGNTSLGMEARGNNTRIFLEYLSQFTASKHSE